MVILRIFMDRLLAVRLHVASGVVFLAAYSASRKWDKATTFATKMDVEAHPPTDHFASGAGSGRYAQPRPGFSGGIPSFHRLLAGMQITDIYFNYAEGGCNSWAAHFAQERTLALGTDHQPHREPIWA